ncbi:hypothetical protein [Amycolatopsis sp. cmx-4-61]|uniref:hypothetical protein n=1 Tax=Amycolatopsis sp. cmx-4-61 TaxID=2790937 RepID=UPI0039780A59
MGDVDPRPFTVEDGKRYVESHLKDTWAVVAEGPENVWTPVGYAGMFVRSRHRVGIFRIAIGSLREQRAEAERVGLTAGALVAKKAIADIRETIREFDHHRVVDHVAAAQGYRLCTNGDPMRNLRRACTSHDYGTRKGACHAKMGRRPLRARLGRRGTGARGGGRA